jgi:uncharacterized OsmC-like protein
MSPADSSISPINTCSNIHATLSLLHRGVDDEDVDVDVDDEDVDKKGCRKSSPALHRFKGSI